MQHYNFSWIKRNLLHNAVIAWIHDVRELKILEIPADKAREVQHNSMFNLDCLADLEKFEQTESWLTRPAFLSEAQIRLRNKEHVFTHVINDTLAAYGWIVAPQASSFFPYVGQSYTYREGSAVSYNFYVHPHFRGRGLYQQVARQSTQTAASAFQGIQFVYGAVASTNPIPLHVKVKMGYVCVASLFRRTSFGKVSKMRVDLQP